MVAFFRTAPVQWEGDARVHAAWNSVFERSAKYVRCGMKIGPSPKYDGDLVVDCPACLAGLARDKRRTDGESRG